LPKQNQQVSVHSVRYKSPRVTRAMLINKNNLCDNGYMFLKKGELNMYVQSH